MIGAPDLVIFLDLDGPAAFERKEDLPLEVKIASSQAYRAGLREIPNVVTIDASQSKDQVFVEAMRALLATRSNALRHGGE
jgi:thymidylate kinase